MEPDFLLIVIAAILYGTITPGAQMLLNLGMTAYELALFSMLFMSLMLLPAIILRPAYRIKRDMLRFFIVFGLFNAFQEITQFAALGWGVPVAVVALLMYCQPIWTTLFGRLMLKERIDGKKILALVIALIGIIVIVEPWKITGVVSMPLRGIIAAILGGLFLSLWVIWSRIGGINKKHHVTAAFGCMSFSFLWLLVLRPIFSLIVQDSAITGAKLAFPPIGWAGLALFALISGVLPAMFFYRGIKKINASTAGIILLLEPVSAALIAALLLAQPLGLNVIIGGIIIIISNFIIQ
jgi:drug/metabolite transporter (DMT)-like permease